MKVPRVKAANPNQLDHLGPWQLNTLENNVFIKFLLGKLQVKHITQNAHVAMHSVPVITIQLSKQSEELSHSQAA